MTGLDSSPAATYEGQTVEGIRPLQRIRRPWLPALVPELLLGFALAVLTWPSSPSTLFVTSGADASWRSALEIAAHNGMPFGTQVVYTYGPLGFLTAQQLNYGSIALASFLFTLGFFTLLLATLIWALRRALPLWGALLVAYVLGAVSLQTDYGASGGYGSPESVYVAVLIVCVAVLSRSRESQAPSWIWAGLGVVLSVFSLVKVSLGVGLVLVLIITLICLPCGRWRAVRALALGAVPTFCLAWFGTGNRFGNLEPFVRSSYAVISGYGPAMSVNSSESLFGYVPPSQTFVFWWAALVVIVIGALAFAHTYKLTSRARIGILLATLVVVWLLFKEGFVRNDSSHNLIFFAAAPLLVTAFDLGRRFWGVLLAGVLALCSVTIIVAGGMPRLVYEPFTSAQNFFHETRTLASAGQRAHLMEGSREFLRDWYEVPAPMLALVRGQTVDVAPEEQSVAWAYPEVHFDPLPVVQDYVAWTPFLDQLDRSYLASSEAPRFILRSTGAIDGRNPAFEPPATQLAIECRYREVMATGNWQLLQRSRNRCGPTRYLGTVTTGFNHWIAVPQARSDDSVVATFDLSLGSLWELQSIVYKPPQLFMGYNYGQQYWRFVAATAPDLHVLHAASTLNYSRPFVPTSVTRFRFFFGVSPGSHPAIKVSFYEIHLK